MDIVPIPKGDVAREAIDALRGYVYQIYQSALAWIELEPDELLFLEVAEDYTVVASNALKGVQVKETGHSVTINSDDIIIITLGVDDLGKSQIREGSSDAGIAFFPEHYGEYVIPAALTMLEGKAVPPFIYIENEVITLDNIDKWYPQ